LLVLVSLAGLIFCSVPTTAVGAAELKAELVNKELEGWSGASLPTGQVQLTYPDGRTHLLPYRSHLKPLAANGKVFIFTTKNLEITRIVIYDSASGQAQSFPLPEDLVSNNYFCSPSFSPDGTKVAYYFDREAKHEPHWSYIDRTDKAVPRPPDSRPKKVWPQFGQLSEGLAQVSELRSVGVQYFGKMGYKDETGNIVIPLQFDYSGYFSEGLAPVEIGKKWGFIDKTGKTVIPLQYTLLAHSFSEGLAAVRVRGQGGFGKWGFIDKEGKMVIPPQYDGAHNFSEGLARVAVDGKYGFIDQTGKMVIQPQYDEAEDFSQGVAQVGVGVMEWTLVGGRVRSWPDWQLLWQSPLCAPTGSDAPPLPPIWETNSLAFFDPEFCSPPRSLKYQVP
jgi:hypothetical protein